MSARPRLHTRVTDYLAERRRLGFELQSHDTLLADFAQFVADRHHHGPLTVELMADWVRTGKEGLGTLLPAARIRTNPVSLNGGVERAPPAR